MIKWLEKLLRTPPASAQSNLVFDRELSIRISRYFDQQFVDCALDRIVEAAHNETLDWSIILNENNKDAEGLANWTSVPIIGDEPTFQALNYLAQRKDSTKSYRNEPIVIAYLIAAGEVAAAVELVSVSVQDYFSGKQSSLLLGYLSDKSHVLAMLAFHPDRDVSQQAIAIVRDIFQRLEFFESDLYEILLHFDSAFVSALGVARYHELKAAHSKDSTQDEVLWNHIVSYRRVLIESLSLQLWQQIVALTGYWQKINGAGYYVLEMARWLYADKTISNEIKWSMLDYLMREHPDFQSENWSYNQVKIYELMLLISSDFSLSLIGKYTHPDQNRHSGWRQSLAQAKANLNEPSIKEIDSTLSLLQALGYAASVGIDAYDRYLYQRWNRHNYTADDWFLQFLGVSLFDIEGGYYPLNYKHLYLELFQPMLISKGIDNFLFSQINKVGQCECEYRLAVFNGVNDYSIAFTGSSDWYAVDNLLVMLNVALKHSGSDLRFIELVSGDQCCQIVLDVPARLFRVKDIVDLRIGGISDEVWNDLKLKVVA